MPLWPHQQHLISEARAAYDRGARRMLCVLPTGGGKTRVAATIAGSLIASGHTVLFVAHLRELLDQARAVLPQGVDTVSIQSRPTRHYDVVMVDEAHHSEAASYKRALEAIAPTILFGFTATPSRLDGRPLGATFDALCVGGTTSALIASGTLVPTRVFGPSEVPTPGTLAEHPVDAYRAHAHGEKALVYAASVEHAARLADEFTVAGYPARSLDGKTRDRQAVNERFASGEIKILTTYRLIAEGYDVPDCSTVILASNMTSPAMLLQAVGRGKRCAPGKTHETLIDLAGVCMSLGIHPDDNLQYSLEGRPITRTTERGENLRACPECGMLFWAHEYRDSVCPICGYVRPGRPDPHVVKAEMEEQRQEFFRELARKKPEEVLFMRGLLQEGHKPGWWRRKFRKKFGHWPSKALVEMARSGQWHEP